MCALLQGEVPLVKFIDSNQVDSILQQPHNIPNLSNTALQQQKLNLELSIHLEQAFELEPVFYVDLCEHGKQDVKQPGDTWRRIISSYLSLKGER